MRRIRLYCLTALVTAAVLSGCSATPPSNGNSTGTAETAEATGAEQEGTAEETTAAEGAGEEAAAAEGTGEETAEAGEADGSAEESQPAQGQDASEETKAEDGAESGDAVISPEVAEGHVIAPEASEEELAEVVNVNFELVTRDEMVHAVITGINRKDEVVWQNVTPDFAVSETPALTGLMILADSYFYLEDGDVVRLNKETGVEYWRNTEFGDRIADRAWAQQGETFYFAGAENTDLFVMSMHGQTIKRVRTFNELFGEPERLRLENGRILITCKKTQTGKPALISVDPEDYSAAILVDTDVVPEITDNTLYKSNTRTTLALRCGPGQDYESFDSEESGTEMYVLKVVGDYAYVYVKETGQVAYCTGQYVLADDGSYKNAVEIAEEKGTAQSAEDAAAEPQEGTAAETTGEPGAEPTAETPAPEGDGTVYYVDVASSLYLRKEPDYSSDYVTSLEPLTELTLLGYENDLAHVRVNATGEEGYVAPKFITDDLNNLRYAEAG